MSGRDGAKTFSDRLLATWQFHFPPHRPTINRRADPLPKAR